MKRRFVGFMALMSLIWIGAFTGLWDPTAVMYRVGIGRAEVAIGASIDSLNGVDVYYNGPISNVSGRNVSPDGYNIGQKYQCVEFVKRYYYQALGHAMPDSYGHAKDFFDPKVADGQINASRALVQYTNGGSATPKVGDLLVFDGTIFNRYGHVAIVSEVTDTDIEFIQQNPGPSAPSRERLNFVARAGTNSTGKMLDASALLGWLRKAE